jgi:signal transduction histidine kinase
MSLVGESSHTAWALAQGAEAMLNTIGRQIGIAIENASLYERLRHEQTVQRQLMERSINLQEEERRYISRELHDSTGQRLTSMIMTLRTLERSATTEYTRQSIQNLRETATKMLVELRNMALRLRPSVLDDLGLLAALREYTKEYQSHYHILIDYQVLAPPNMRLLPDIEIGLFRITQEALTNIARHASAANVTVILELRGDSALLIVEDDGEGFDVNTVMNTHLNARNLGLHGMRERASLLGGTVEIESTPGTGTTVFVRIPTKEGSTCCVENTSPDR